MKTISKKLASAFSSILLTALPSIAQSAAWTGTWKLNKDKSRVGGTAFIVNVLGEREFYIETKSLNYKIVCDGIYRPLVSNLSLACTSASATSMDTAEKRDGKLLNMVHRQLSEDGKTLIQTAVSIGGHELRTKSETTFVRSSRSTGLGGAWSDAHALDKQPQTMVTKLTGLFFRLSFPIQKEYTDMKLDGTDAPTHAPASGARLTLSARTEGLLTLSIVQKLNGTVVSLGELILSEDGRVITEKTWRPEAPNAKTELVYERQ